MADYYSILGLPRDASKEQIKKAYRRLAMQWHPDRNPSAEAKQKFILITEAYDALMEGRTFSFQRPAARKTEPKQKTPEEQRKERVMRYYDMRRRQFADLRRKYRQPGTSFHFRFYAWIYTCFVAAGLLMLAGILLPVMQGNILGMVVTLPIGLGLGVRILRYALMKKYVADMLFGEEENYSFRELNLFFKLYERDN